MYKIAICVRNRLGVTKKCIEAIKRHSVLENQIYIFDNLTDYRVRDHFEYFCKLHSKGMICQYVVNSKQSTYNAFSKAVALNHFGLMHEMDPLNKETDFLVFLDNDIIVTPQWDKIISMAWKDLDKHKLKSIKVVGQLPGGIKFKKPIRFTIAGMKAKIGKFGGSGLWAVKSDFFKDVGYLDISKLVGKNKQHDQHYWKKMDKKNNGREYIIGLETKLGIHVGKMAGSVCNRLHSSKLNNDISFKEADKNIEELKFDDFYNYIINDKGMFNDW